MHCLNVADKPLDLIISPTSSSAKQIYYSFRLAVMALHLDADYYRSCNEICRMTLVQIRSADSSYPLLQLQKRH